jgi:hypothetical protein
MKSPHFTRIPLSLTFFVLTISIFAFQTDLIAQNAIQKRIEALHAQGQAFETVQLIENRIEKSTASFANYDVADAANAEGAVVFPFAKSKSNALVDKRDYIALSLPLANGALLDLQLYRKSPLTEDYQVMFSDGQKSVVESEALFYRGVVKDVDGSLVALSIFDDEVRAVISAGDAHYVLGKIKGATDGAHLIYRSDLLEGQEPFSCEAIESHDDMDMELPSSTEIEASAKTEKCVRLRVEVNSDLTANLGGHSAAMNYTMGLFNEVTTLFDNDDISVAVSEIFIWVDSSPYSGSVAAMLGQVSNTSPNADLTALLANGGGGGIAYLSSVCSSTFGKSVSGVYSSYSSVPTYSWDVMVCTHEIGHNISSPHTHACSWNGNNTPLDGCGIEAGYSEGSCGTAPVPADGGTIMSYCHLRPVGINFNQGFGAQPRTRIINYINSKTCLGPVCISVANTPCVEPYPQLQNLSASVETAGVQLNWTAIQGSIGCQIQGGKVGSTILTTIDVYTPNLSSYFIPASMLPGNTTYRVRVRCACSTSPNIVGPWTSFTNFSWSSASGLEPLAEQTFGQAESSLRIYPNPSLGPVQVALFSRSEGSVHIRVFDLVGKQVFAERRQATEGSNVYQLDLAALGEAMYLVQVEGPDGMRESQRMVISR